MEPVYAPRRKKRINKNNKLHLVFDEDARREFLTGFHKRKLQRKKAAEEELKNQLKEERKRIKQESRERFKKLHSYKPIPELEKQLAKEYEMENATVSILDLDADLLAETNFLIGRNRGEPEPEIKEEIEEETQCEEELPGMELKTKIKIKSQKIKLEDVDKLSTNPTIETKNPKSKDKQVETIKTESKTKKELKKELKKEATKKIKKSKAFQKKNRLERAKQKKISMRLKKDNLKIKARSKKGQQMKRKTINKRK